MKNLIRSLVLGCSVLALAGCGPDDIASPGSGGNITINYPAPAPTPTPTPTPTTSLVTAAAGCPTISDAQGLTDSGTITGPTGTWRVCTLPKVLMASSTLPKIAGLVYQMNGRVDVGCDGGFSAPSAGAPYATSTVGCATASLTADTNVTLTIQPGVILYGGTGTSWLAVNRGNKINATGTATSPIIFTSRDNILGLNTNSSQGQWGGVVLMGRAPTTDCTTGTVAGGTCERQTEGATDPARYGGNKLDDNSGTIKFVQIRYSGFVLSAGIELQSLTTEGIGSGTTLDSMMSFNSSDDGSEFFGGNFGFKHYIAVGADDDSLDVDTGAQANFQYALLLPRPTKGDSMMEIDSNGNESDTPRTKLLVANFTAVQQQASADNEAADQAALLFRGNSDTTLVNGVVVTPNNECIRMNGSSSGGSAASTLTARSVVLSCNATKYIGSGTYTAANVQTAFGSGANNNNDALTSTLTGLFVNGTNETAVTATDPKTFASTGFSAFIDTTAFIGAYRSTDTWAQGWTCNSDVANFGTGNSGNCTSLPTT